MLSFVPSASAILPGLRRSFFAACPAAKAKAKSKPSSPQPTPPPDASSKSADDRVLLLEVKKKVLEILEEEGPISRRKIYDQRLSKLFPLSPFSPNPPPRPLWLRTQYTPEEERVYLTMSKFKRRLIRSLVHDGTVSVMTIAKVRKLIAEIDEKEQREDILTRKAKLERAVASESDKTFVWVLEHWVKLLKQKSVNRALEEARITGRPVASRWKRA